MNKKKLKKLQNNLKRLPPTELNKKMMNLVIRVLEECKDISEDCLRTEDEERWLEEMKSQYDFMSEQDRWDHLFK